MWIHQVYYKKKPAIVGLNVDQFISLQYMPGVDKTAILAHFKMQVSPC